MVVIKSSMRASCQGTRLFFPRFPIYVFQFFSSFISCNGCFSQKVPPSSGRVFLTVYSVITEIVRLQKAFKANPIKGTAMLFNLLASMWASMSTHLQVALEGQYKEAIVKYFDLWLGHVWGEVCFLTKSVLSVECAQPHTVTESNTFLSGMYSSPGLHILAAPILSAKCSLFPLRNWCSAWFPIIPSWTPV